MNDVTYKAAPDVLFQEVNDELVLLDIDSERYFGLNHTGARVWELAEQGEGRDRIVEKLSEEFDADPEVLKRDVLMILDQLLESGLLQEV